MADEERRDRLRVALADAQDALTGLALSDGEETHQGRELLRRVLAYGQVVIEQTDPSLITDDALSTTETEAQSIVSDPLTAVGSARVSADELLEALASLPAARDRDVEQAVKDAAANFQRSATMRLNAIEADVDAKTSEIAANLESLRASVESATTETQSEIETQATTFETRLAEFDATLTSQRQAINEALERQSQTFTESQAEKADAFQAEVVRAKAEIDAFLADAKEDVDERVSEIRRMEDESSGLVNSIGLGGTAERYGKEADEQEKVADKLRLLTIVLAIGAVVMAFFAVVHEADETSAILAKLGVSIVFGALATYTARQSGRHRVREERARNLQLELTAFAPFIELLGDDQKELERVIMTRKTFGQIRALPEAEGDHAWGPLGPVMDRLKRNEASADE